MNRNKEKHQSQLSSFFLYTLPRIDASIEAIEPTQIVEKYFPAFTK